MNRIEKFFELKAKGSSIGIEFLAGLTTFMTMAFIIAVNPAILSATGMDPGGLFTATILGVIVPTLIMALWAKYPYAIAPGMGLNAYFAFIIAAEFGWQLALLSLFFQGILFIILASVNFREKILEAIPSNIKLAIGAGIGVFIALIGFQEAGFVAYSPATLVTLGDIGDITVGLFMIGCVCTVILLALKIKGGIFFGIVITYVLGLMAQAAGLYVPHVLDEYGAILVAGHGFSLMPGSIVSAPPSIAEVNIITAFRQADWVGVSIMRYITVFIAFFIVDVLDTVSTLVGVSEKAGFLDKNGKLPRAKQAFLADAIGTSAGAAFGTSTTTVYIESAAGIAVGGKTGLTALFVAGFFAVCLFFWPVISVIPSFATSPALVVVGLYMVSIVRKINFEDFAEGFPAFLTIIVIPFTYSISYGLIFGILSYVLIKIFTGKAKETSWVMYVLSIFFIIKLIVV